LSRTLKFRNLDAGEKMRIYEQSVINTDVRIQYTSFTQFGRIDPEVSAQCGWHVCTSRFDQPVIK